MLLNIISYYYATFYTPLLAIFLGLGVISDEVETKNITFIMVRPLARGWIVFGRLAGHCMVGASLIAICATGIYLANLVFQAEELFGSLLFLANAIIVMALGLVGYLSVIATLGTFWKKFAILASIFWLVFDNLFSRIPVELLNNISIMFSMFDSFSESVPGYGLTLVTLNPGVDLLSLVLRVLVYAGLSCALMIFRLKSFEIVLSEGAK